MRLRFKERRGGVYVEFVLVTAFFLVPLILGLLSVGFALSRSLQAAQLTRDIGRMFVRGVDFSEPANQELITGSASRPNLPALARGLGMVGNGGGVIGGTEGNGVVVLSTFTRMSNTCNCNNAGRIVLTRRIVIGNRNLFSSPFGNPDPSLLNSTTGVITDYPNQISARADGLASVVNLSSGELAYLVESRFTFPDLAIPGVMPDPSVFWRAVF